MYIRVKKRENKNGKQVFFLYLCESKRVEGKVTNKQKYLLSIREQDLMNGCYNEQFRTKLSALESEERQMVEKKVLETLEKLPS